MLVMRRFRTIVAITLITVIAALFYCEYLIYYQTLSHCSYPAWEGVQPSTERENESTQLRAMFVADTHLLGKRNGHWLDKLKREWQMHRAFQTALYYFQPEVVFFLGDLTDEGKWAPPEEFDSTVDRFNRLFAVNHSYVDRERTTITKVGVVAGNHDIGFHYAVSPYLEQRFRAAFNTKNSVRQVMLKGIDFVLINSVAFEGDNCTMCKKAELALNKVSKNVECNSTDERECSRPIVLSHYPLYRPSDSECNEPDSAPPAEKEALFRPKWDCLSEEATQLIIDKLNPRLAFTGHTHHGCVTQHPNSSLTEWTVASFSWRNKKNPSFLLATITPHHYQVSKCYMPEEGNVYNIYILFATIPVFTFFKFKRKTL